MCQFYGTKWISSYSEQDQGNVWLAGLNDLTPDKLKNGIRECMDIHPEWPPTLPQFRKACLSIKRQLVELGIPLPEKALREAASRAHEQNKSRLNWSHICVYIAAQKTGWYELRSRTEKQLFPAYNSHYKDVCNRFINGEDFSKQLPKPDQVEPGKKPISKEEMERNIYEARKELGLVK